ncbi:MAG: peptidoglycan DD-metalloendopeptidase family protein [Balneolales bacterium]
MFHFIDTHFAPVVNINRPAKIFDFTMGYDPEYISRFSLGIGRYNEKRKHMYVSNLYKDGRDVHMGVDFWMPAGSDVFSFWDGNILLFQDNANFRDYGPTIITEHVINQEPIYALFGHLSRNSLKGLSEGQLIKKGDKIAEIGTENENGGWVPHLHFQISIRKPTIADMPGVVADKDLNEALRIYPDPGLVLGKLY